MGKNLTQKSEPHQFDGYDPDLWFNIVIFFAIFLMLSGSFFVFRGTKKNSKYSNDEYAEDFESEDEDDEITSGSLMSSHVPESKKVLQMHMVYVPPKMT